MPSIYDDDFPISKKSKTYAAIQQAKGIRTAFAPVPLLAPNSQEKLMIQDGKKEAKKKRERSRSFYSLGYYDMLDQWPPGRVKRSVLQDRKRMLDQIDQNEYITLGQVAKRMGWVRSRADGHMKSLRIMGYLEREGEAYYKMMKPWSDDGWAIQILEDEKDD